MKIFFTLTFSCSYHLHCSAPLPHFHYSHLLPLVFLAVFHHKLWNNSFYFTHVCVQCFFLLGCLLDRYCDYFCWCYLISSFFLNFISGLCIWGLFACMSVYCLYSMPSPSETRRWHLICLNLRYGGCEQPCGFK